VTGAPVELRAFAEDKYVVPYQEKLASVLAQLGSPATDLLGACILDIDQAAGSAKFSFLARPEFANMLGNVQGGFVAAMLDETAGLTARLIADAEIVVPTLDFRVTFLVPAKIGPLFSVGRCLKVGRQIAFMEADLLDGDGTLLSRMSVTALAMQAMPITK
jgi:uncharacterized protein (TIGR00369 family)